MDMWDGDDPGDSDSWLKQLKNEHNNFYSSYSRPPIEEIEANCYICGKKKIKIDYYHDTLNEVHHLTFRCCRTETKTFSKKDLDKIIQGKIWLAFI